MNFVSFLSHLISTSHIEKQNSNIKQAPELPAEVINKIFLPMKMNELSCLSRSCKDWNEYAQPYLRWLKTEAVRLYKSCEKNNYSVRIDRFNMYDLNLVHRLFTCKFRNDKIMIEESSNPDFRINAMIRVLWTPIEDCACSCRQYKIFCCSGNCDDLNFATRLCYIDFINIKETLTPAQKKHIKVILNAMKIYARYRFNYNSGC